VFFLEDAVMANLSSQTLESSGMMTQPTLTKAQESLLFRAAGRRVAAAVFSQQAESSDKLLGDVANMPVYGAFVTLKRDGRLRSCCGCLGTMMTVCDALDQAADRAATDDPRFPPIAPEELNQLEMHVWLLWGPTPVTARGEDRVNAIVIGKHGLQIARGGARGLLLPSVATEFHLDARGFLEQVCLKAGLSKNAWKDDETTLLVFEGSVVEGPFEIEQIDVRPPAVAGSFYPGSSSEIEQAIDKMIAANPKCHPQPWAGVLTPHAGWVHSGALAFKVLQRVEIPDHVIVLCPKHRPGGATWAVAPQASWAFPGGEIKSDPALAIRLAEAIVDLKLDATSHAQEHAIEVQLPFLARLAPQTRVVGIIVGERPLPELLRFGSQLAEVIRPMSPRPLLMISSDMHHFSDDVETRRLDQLAIDAIQTLNPIRLYETVQRNRISMCGAAACTVVMEALRKLDVLNCCELVGQTTSAESTGMTERVVGYAGMLLGSLSSMESK
jgi:AmmeMemoRadiSam system protein B/AmmeMemoRadiSam system protein A